MPRYIDADALMQKLCNECDVKDREYFCRAICGDKMNIDNTPTADVEPVRHGRWIVNKESGEYAECSECKDRSGTQFDGVESIPLMTRYCPHCGAIMDGGEREDNDSHIKL